METSTMDYGDTRVTSVAPWMAVAAAEIGVKEYPGTADNPRVIEYARAARIQWYTHDATPWCAVAVGAILAWSGYKNTGSALARSYLNYGYPVDGPHFGAIAILKRGTNPNMGHVGFVVAHKSGYILLRSGNQSDAFCDQWYPLSDVIGYRWPLADVDAAPPLRGQSATLPLFDTVVHAEPAPLIEPQRSTPVTVLPEGSRTLDATQRLESAAKASGLVVTVVTAIKTMFADIGIAGAIGLSAVVLAATIYTMHQARMIRAYRIEDHCTGKHTGR